MKVENCRRGWWTGAWIVLLGSIVGSSDGQDVVPAESVTLAGQRFTLPADYEISLAASSELVPRPIVADLDDRGDLFVADSSGSNADVQTQLRERPHRILRLRDTDGDGQYDQRTVFADRMMFPEGVMCWRGSVLVSAPPQIWQLTDTDGDGVADRREVWFDGQTLTGCANDLHGPYRGRDGWIYWCKGAFAEQTYAVDPQRQRTSRAAHIFRRHPDGGPVEAVMTGGMDNPVDVVITTGGERIFTTTFLQHPAGGKRDGLIHAVYGGVYGKIHGVLEGHPRTGDYLPPLVHLGPAAPCGLTILESVRASDQAHDELLSCAFNLHQVWHHRLEPSGASFVAHSEPWLTSESLDFHPTDVLEDADGSVLVVDTGGWYKLCCPSSQLDKPDVLGGIYRLRRKAAAAAADGYGRELAWTELDAPSLVALLDDARWRVRQQAADRLRLDGEDALLALRRAQANGSVRQRREIAWIAASHDAPDAELARHAVTDSDPLVRQIGWQVLGLRRVPAADLVPAGLADPVDSVRRAAAEAAGRIGSVEVVPALLAALPELPAQHAASTGQPESPAATTPDPDAGDRMLEHSVIYALIELADTAALRAQLPNAPPRAQRAVWIALDQIPDGGLQAEEVLPFLVDSTEETRSAALWLLQRHPEWAAPLMQLVAQRLTSSTGTETPGDWTPAFRLVRDDPGVQAWFAQVGDPQQTPSLQAWCLRQLAELSMNVCSPELQAMLARHLEQVDGAFQPQVLDLVLAVQSPINDARLQAALAAVANDEQLPQDRRCAAFAKLPAGKHRLPSDLFSPLLAQLTADDLAERRRAAVTIAQAALDAAQTHATIARLGQLGPMELPDVLRALARADVTGVQDELLAQLTLANAVVVMPLETLREPFSQAPASFQQQLTNLWHARRPVVADQAARLEELLHALPSGDIRRGQQVFHSAKAACFTCHALGYRGGDVGPDLTKIGGIRTRRDLLESILFPSASFVRSFEPQTVVLRTGQVLQGVIQDETATSIRLIDAQREVRQVARDQIEELTPGTVSIMPSGLDQILSPQDLADLLEFLGAAK